VILLGAAPRTKNMQRKDLLKLNGGIFKEVGLKLRNTKNNPKVLVVGNPCNTNALVAMHHSDLSHSNFFAMTALDEMRAKSLIAQKLNSNLKDINDVYIYGNHSNTMVPDLSQASINNNLIINMLSKKWIDESFIPMVKSRGASIIEHRQASSAASAAMAVINSIIAIVEKKSISIACSKANPFSINSELIYSYPINFETEIGAVKKINLNQETLNLMKISEQELLLERDLVCELNLL
jgi:malate/lactate dehydrogenase